MGRVLDSERNKAIAIEIGRRLDIALAWYGTGPHTATVLAAGLARMLGVPEEVDRGAEGENRLALAAHALTEVRAGGSAPQAILAWADCFLRPLAANRADRLPGADRLWARLVALERDRLRRNAIQKIPVRLTLGAQDRRFLAEIMRVAGTDSVAAVITDLIKKRYLDLKPKSEKAAQAQQPVLL